MMTMFEKLKVFTVKVRRAYWQWRAANVTKATFTGGMPKERCGLGVTLSGGEFTPGGPYDQSYGYPPVESIDYYARNGFKIVRLPILWERIQPKLYGDLDETEMARIDYSVRHILDCGMKVGIDLHNGGYYKGDVIGSKSVPDAAFADVWSRLAKHYWKEPNALFMLMSEPSDQCARQWVRTANAAIAAIRETRATQTIVVPGSYFDGGWTWCKSDNAKQMLKLKDPLNDLMIEIHQYMDRDGSGGTSGIVSTTIGADRLVDVTLWARSNNFRLFLGEFAAASDPVSMVALHSQLRYVMENSDVWKFAAWWGGGDRWMNYIFQLDPIDYANPVDHPQMEILKAFI